MRLISEEDIERLIDPRIAIEAAAEAYRRQATGSLPEPGRLDLPRQDPAGNVLVLAGHGGDGVFCVKSNVHVYPEAASRQRLAASMMLLWDTVQCRPLALLSTTGFNNHRTAAGFAVAADALGAPSARTLAIFGAGKIAPAVIRYLMQVRPLERILILGRGQTRARALAGALQSQPPFAECEVRAESDAAKAARDADIIVTVTTAADPVFPGDVVRPGTLVILAGANRPHAREADDALIARATIYLDHREGCLTRAGDLAMPLASGRLAPAQIAGEIGQLLTGSQAPMAADVTVFKSIGVIAQDITLAHMIVQNAIGSGIGWEFDATTGRASQAAPHQARAS